MPTSLAPADVELLPATFNVRANGPAFTASAMPIHAACDSALARQDEFSRFLARHELEPLPSSDAAERGTQIHAVIAAVPYAGPEIPDADAPPRQPAAVREAVDRLAPTLDKGGRRFAVSSILRRNALFNALIKSVEDFTGEAPVIVQVFADDTRIRAALPGGERVSALIDGGLVVRAGNQGFAAVIDFKSGDAPEGAQNPQLLTQAYLVNRFISSQGLETGRVLATLINPAVFRASQPPPSASLSPEHFARIEEVLDEGTLRSRAVATDLASAEDMNTGEVSAAAEEAVESHAVAGDHCLYCTGKMCCGAFMSHVSTEAERIEARHPGFLAAAGKALGRKGTSADLSTALNILQPHAMKPDRLALALHTLSAAHPALKLADQLREEGEDLARSMVAPLLTQASKAQGERRFEDADKALAAAAETVPGMQFVAGRVSYEFAADPDFANKPLQPAAVFDRLQPLIGEPLRAIIAAHVAEAESTGQPPPSTEPYDWFLSAGCASTATAVRAFVAEVLQIPPEEAMAKMMDLGTSNPLRPKVAQASVKLDPQRLATLRAEAAGDPPFEAPPAEDSEAPSEAAAPAVPSTGGAPRRRRVAAAL